jgi:hypothetical protein
VWKGGFGFSNKKKKRVRGRNGRPGSYVPSGAAPIAVPIANLPVASAVAFGRRNHHSPP